MGNSENHELELLYHLPIGVIIIDARTLTIEMANHYVSKAMGLPVEEIIGRQCSGFLCPKGQSFCPAYHLGQILDNWEHVLLRADGTLLHVLKTVRLVKLGGKEKLLVSLVDITHRKQLEERIGSSEKKYQSLFEKAREGIIIIIDQVELVNPAAEEILERSKYTLTREPFADIFHPEDRPVVSELLRGLKEERDISDQFDARIITPDGRVKWIRISSGTVDWEGERAVMLLFNDVTERKMTLNALKESEERFRRLAENAPDVIYRRELRPEPRCTYVSPAVFDITGYTPEDFYSSPELVSRIIHPDDRDMWEQRLQDMSMSKKALELRWIRKDGSICWVEQRVIPILDENGEVVAIEGIARDITERKLAEERLRHSEGKFRALFEKAGQGIVILRDGIIEFANPSLEHISERSIAEIISQPFTRFIHPEDRDMVLENYLKRTKGEYVPSGYDFRILTPDGRAKWVNIKAQVVDWGGYRADLVFITDITDQKISELKLQESERRYRELFEEAIEGIFQSTPDGRFITVSPSYAHMLGYESPEELIDTITDIETQIYVYPEERKRFKSLLEEHGMVEGFEMQEYRKDGSIIWVSVTAKAVKDMDGKILYYAGYVVDITRQRQAEEELRKLAQAVRHSPASIVITDRNGTIEYVNPKFTEVTGYTYEEVIGQNPRVLKSEDQPKEFYKELWDTILSGKEWRGEFKNRKKNGEIYWEQASISPIKNEKGEITHFVAVKEDITQRKLMENELKHMEELIKESQSVGNVGSWELDLVTNTLLWSEEVYRIFGANPQDFKPSYEAFLEIVHPDDRLLVHNAYISSIENKEDHYEVEHRIVRRDNGEIRYVLEKCRHVKDSSGKVIRSIGMVQDITQRKELEMELLEANEKLAANAVGLRDLAEQARQASMAKSVFLASMSHEIRTPLSAIIGFAQILEMDPSLNEKQRDQVRAIIKSGNHLLELINDILDISRIEAGKLELKPEAFSLRRLLDEIKVTFISRAEAKGLKFILDPGEGLPGSILADKGKLRQIITNLLGNAIKFTQNGWVALRVRSEKVPSGQEELVRLIFEVEDTGPGISSSEKDKIFDVFSQGETGARIGGTGLGLAISSRLAKLMGGELTVESEVGKGSIFRFDITCKVEKFSEIDEQEWDQGRKVIGIEPTTGPYRILVADDVQSNREILVELLQGVGFQVREAENGEEAIRIFEEWSPHAIFMDMRMPVMDGFEATRRIKATDKGKDTHVIAITASAFKDSQERVLGTGVSAFISKPFHVKDIFEALRRCLGIRYVYEDEPSQATKISGLTKESLAHLPKELLKAMREAVEDGDILKLEGLISQVQELDKDVALGLKALAQRYDYSNLLRLLS